MNLKMMQVEGCVFEDTIDGYFPLKESLAQLMSRYGFSTAWLTFVHAPVVDIPGLAADAPVPFNVCDCKAGIVERMSVQLSDSSLGGFGRWVWIDADGAEPDVCFDSNVRLAEPVLVTGIGLLQGDDSFGRFESIRATTEDSGIAVARMTEGVVVSAFSGQWSVARIWSMGDIKGIHATQSVAVSNVVEGQLIYSYVASVSDADAAECIITVDRSEDVARRLRFVASGR